MLGAIATVLIIWGLLVWLTLEAIIRILDPALIQVKPTIMLYTACIGFGCNILNLIVLFCCCNEPKKDDDEEKPRFVVDDLIDRLKLGRGGLLSRKSPKSKSTPTKVSKIVSAVNSINGE